MKCGLWQHLACLLLSPYLFLCDDQREIPAMSAIVLERRINEYAKIAPAHLTASAGDKATGQWIFEELSRAGLHVEYQSYVLPGPPIWLPQEDGAPSSGYGCQLVVDSINIPCYVVQQPPLHPAALHEVPMERILVVSSMNVYILKAEDVYHRYLRPDGTLPYDAVIVMNAFFSENVTQPRPFNWNQGIVASSMVPVVTVSYAFQELLRSGKHLNSLRLLGRRQHVTTRNVLAYMQPHPSVPKDDKSVPVCSKLQPLYLGTPVNGFFQAAGERGAGIALLMAIAEDLQTSTCQRCRCHCQGYEGFRGHKGMCWLPIFAFTSGHEQFDTGISVGTIPYLRELCRRLKISFAEVPFISIGANLAMHSHFKGSNFMGPGSGTLPVKVSTSNFSGESQAMLDRMLHRLGHLQFVQASAGTMNASNTIGAVFQALSSGMPAMNLVGADLGYRFHLPSDADSSSVNITSLHSLTLGMSEALTTALCRRTPRRAMFMALQDMPKNQWQQWYGWLNQWNQWNYESLWMSTLVFTCAFAALTLCRWFSRWLRVWAAAGSCMALPPATLHDPKSGQHELDSGP